TGSAPRASAQQGTRPSGPWNGANHSRKSRASSVCPARIRADEVRAPSRIHDRAYAREPGRIAGPSVDQDEREVRAERASQLLARGRQPEADPIELLTPISRGLFEDLGDRRSGCAIVVREGGEVARCGERDRQGDVAKSSGWEIEIPNESAGSSAEGILDVAALRQRAL